MTHYPVDNNTRMGLVIFLCSNSNNLISYYPPNCLNFRHLLSCGTIGIAKTSLKKSPPVSELFRKNLRGVKMIPVLSPFEG